MTQSSVLRISQQLKLFDVKSTLWLLVESLAWRGSREFMMRGGPMIDFGN
jgi:hypothetical protein